MDEKRCRLCGAVVPVPRRGPTGEYCGSACKQKAYRQRRKVERLAARQQFINRKVGRK